MNGYGQFCPVAIASEILTRRWTPLVVRELLCGSVRFNEIRRGVPRMSRSLLSQRLGELERAGLLERRMVGGHPEYYLTDAGEELRPIIEQLGAWGKRRLKSDLSREHLDAGFLMWDVQRRVVRERLPPDRVVVHFHFSDAPEEYTDFWLVLEPEAVDLCLDDPGYGWDLRLATDVRTLVEVWMGDIELAHALDDGSIELRGRRELRRRFPSWLGLSVLATVQRLE